MLRNGHHDRFPDDVRAYLELVFRSNVERNAHIHDQCLAIGVVLADAGMQAVLLKGAGCCSTTIRRRLETA